MLKFDFILIKLNYYPSQILYLLVLEIIDYASKRFY